MQKAGESRVASSELRVLSLRLLSEILPCKRRARACGPPVRGKHFGRREACFYRNYPSGSSRRWKENREGRKFIRRVSNDEGSSLRNESGRKEFAVSDTIRRKEL